MSTRTRPTHAAVAKVYLEAAARGLPPTKAVRERYGISQSTAGAWVAMARAAKLLPQMRAGRPGTRNPKAVAVAKALKVDYDDLVRAVLMYAGGDLRVAVPPELHLAIRRLPSV